ncbi:MAG: coat protein [Bacteriophage sp.]|jgi:hypothetical protein|nr:MAG: coat protein [Bacteriophage sp.]
MATVTNTSTFAVNKNMIIPEVYSALVQEKIAGKCHVANMAKVLGDLQGKPGETLTIPAVVYDGDATDYTPGEAMSATNLKTKTKTFTIKAIAAPAYNIYDFDSETEMFNSIENASKNQSTAIARKMDADAIAEALKAPLKSKIATANAITQDELLDALGLFGDDRNVEDFAGAGIVAHSAFAKSFYGMDLFVKSTSTTAQDGNGIVRGDCIGSFLGINVYLSDRCVDKSEPVMLLIKTDALGIIPKETPFSEVARDASKRLSTIYCSDAYAVGVIDESGIVVVRKTIG